MMGSSLPRPETEIHDYAGEWCLYTDALIDGDADIAFLAFHNFEIVESRHRGFEADLCELADYGVPDFNQLILTASDAKIENDPDQVQRFIDATRRGIADTVEDGEAALDLFFERHPQLREDDPELMDRTADATLNCFRADLSQDLEMYRDLVEFCAELDLSDRRVDVEEFTDERFAE